MTTVIDTSKFTYGQENRSIPEITPPIINLEERWFEGNLTPKEINGNNIFLFGANYSGYHNAGAAYYAKKYFGAIQGMSFCQFKNCYALPTKGWFIENLPLIEIQDNIEAFLTFSQTEYGKVFTYYVTAVGTGLCRYDVSNIAPFFTRSLSYENIILCKEFFDYLTNDK